MSPFAWDSPSFPRLFNVSHRDTFWACRSAIFPIFEFPHLSHTCNTSVPLNNSLDLVTLPSLQYRQWPACQVTQYCFNTWSGILIEQMISSMGRGMEVISMWHCWGVMEAQFCFDNGRKLICNVQTYVSNLPHDNTTQILCGVQVRTVGWSVKRSNTTVSTAVTSSFGSVDRCQIELERKISVATKLVNILKHKVL